LQKPFKNVFSVVEGAKPTNSSRGINKPAHQQTNVTATQISEATTPSSSKVEREYGDSISGTSAEDVDGAYRIELSAIEPTWLSIIADGRRAFSGILEATDTKILEAHENVRIRTGNAGGVNVTLNGKALGAIGPRGQVRTVIFTKDAYEILPPEPHMSLTEFTPTGE
jgi:hypothetical protein